MRVASEENRHATSTDIVQWDQTCHVGPGLARPAAAMTPVRFIAQTATSPLVFCYRMSTRPSLLWSPEPMACQSGPGLPMTAWTVGTVAFISQIGRCHGVSPCKHYPSYERAVSARRIAGIGART